MSDVVSVPDAVVISEAARRRFEEFRTAHETRVLTIFFSDLVNSTRLQSDHGNFRATEVVARHQAVVRQLLQGFDGREVDTQGDSFLLVFAAPSEGVRFALRLQAALRDARRDEPLLGEVRVGLHQGQVVVDESSSGAKAYDVYGLQVSTAARIMALAFGGQVLCSRAVFDDARAILTADALAGLGAVAWRNHGSYRFHGVDDAYEVCEVGEEGHAPLRAPQAGAKGWPLAVGEEELGWRPAAGVAVPGTSWVLDSKLGEGGFGEVWLASNRADRSTQVFKFCFRRDRLPALKREARLLKRLRRHAHPSLVQVYDVTEGDRPPFFLEMEYVEGPSMSTWLAGNPPLRERLDLVAQVADALDVVHAAGITHRDIKPSNILLTRREDGVLLAKLSDFGLGAADDEEVLRSLSASRSDGVVGTADYLAPERRTGSPATPQSDLYALGITLYQVLVGDLTRSLPIDWESRLPDDVVRGDVRRSIAPEPDARWRRAADLATALRAHPARVAALDSERARAAQALRAGRLRRLLSTAGVAAVVFLALCGVALWKWREADRHRAEAERQRDLAQGQKRLALEGIARLTHEVPERLRDVPGALPALRDLVQGNLAMLDRILTLEPDTAHARREKMSNYVTAGDAWRRLGDIGKAAEAYEAAGALADRLAAERPTDRQALWDRTLALERLGDVRRLQGRTDDAVAAYEKSLALTREFVGSDLEASGAREDLGAALEKLSGAYVAAGRTADAERALRQSLELAEARVRAAPGDASARRALSIAYERMGDLEMSLARPADALRRYEAGMALEARLQGPASESPQAQRDRSVGHDKIGRALQALGRPDEARPHYEASLQIAERLAAADPADAELQRDVAIGHDRLGDLWMGRGRADEARKAYDRGMAIGERLAAADPANLRAQLDLASGSIKRGNAEVVLGRPDAAREAYVRALEISEAVSSRDPSHAEALRSVGVASAKIGNAWVAAGDPREALRHYDRAAAVARRQVDSDRKSMTARRDLGVASYYAMVTSAAIGDLARWRAAADASIAAFRAVIAESPDDVVAGNDLALALSTAAEGVLGFDPPAPADLAQALVRARERVALPGRADVDAHLLLARVAQRAGASGEAEDALSRALRLLEADPGANGGAERRAEVAGLLEALRAKRAR